MCIHGSYITHSECVMSLVCKSVRVTLVCKSVRVTLVCKSVRVTLHSVQECESYTTQ